MYIDTVSEETKRYYKILSNDFPEFLNDYIETKELQKLDGVCQICGAYWRIEGIYDDMYSVLKHSIGVALIIWHFTHDKKQTIAGLFHDIPSPAFKHCIDFMNGDALKQESTEKQTSDVLRNSEEIMNLLKRDGIALEEVSNFKIYPIADNSTPRLSADRLEYTFMNGTHYKKVWDLDGIAQIYNDIYVTKNEDGLDELSFKSVSMSEKFVNGASELWPLWVRSEDTITMYFFGDIIKKMYEKAYMTKEDLYNHSEKEIIGLIENCEDVSISNEFKEFMNSDDFVDCDEYRADKFCVSRNVKRRYINPLVIDKRVTEISEIAKRKIDGYLNMPRTKYVYYNK